MKNILFTGVSSFSGFHFVREMSSEQNIKIFCLVSKKITNYTSLKRKRIDLIKKNKNVKLIFNVKFGDKNFIRILKEKKFEIICFHHAYTKNYSNDEKFNFSKSIKENLNNVENVFSNIRKNSTIIISNSYFQDSRNKKYKSFSKYGISKNITYEAYKNFSNLYKLKYKSIFINNPWGVFEEKKLNYYLIKNWLEKKEVIIKNPLYVRDNINIEKLSENYKNLAFSKNTKIEYYPSGYCCSNKVFIEALRSAFEKFFTIKTRVKYLKNNINKEPLIRKNGKIILKKINFDKKLDDYFLYYYKLIIK